MKRDRMTTKGFKWGRVFAAFIFVAAIISGSFMQIHSTSAAAGTATWTGLAGDNKFSTAGNWEDDTLPVDGDTIVFKDGVLGWTEGDPWSERNPTLDNDLDITYGGLTVDNSAVTIMGGYSLLNPITFEDGAHITATEYTGGDVVFFYALPAVVDGDLTVGGGLYVSSVNATGNVTVENASYIEDVTAASVTVDATSYLRNMTGTYPVTLNGGTPLQFDADTTSNNPITLNANTKVCPADGATVNFNGAITTNGYTFTKNETCGGSLVVNGQAQMLPPKTTTIDENVSFYDVVESETATLDATLQDTSSVTVKSGGTLKGIGSVDYLSVNGNGVVAPGHSPGTLTVLDTLFLSAGSIYQTEIKNSSAYDQLRVGETYSGSGSAVNINPAATLATILYDGYSITAGEKYTIIDNRSATAVSGTFAGLPEGTQLTVKNVTFSISYVGGDGNDVVLTALTTGSGPSVGNTGSRLSLANPIVVALFGVAASVAILFATSRRKVTKR